MKHLSGGLGSPTNIRLGWKSSPGANALAYCENLQIMAVKSFTTLPQKILKVSKTRLVSNLDTRASVTDSSRRKISTSSATPAETPSSIAKIPSKLQGRALKLFKLSEINFHLNIVGSVGPPQI